MAPGLLSAPAGAEFARPFGLSKEMDDSDR
jgi:hypothetical protein